MSTGAVTRGRRQGFRPEWYRSTLPSDRGWDLGGPAAIRSAFGDL